MSQQSDVEQAVRSILNAIGEDPDREGLRATPQRVARMMEELFSGVGLDAADAIDTVFEEPGGDLDESTEGELVVLREIPFFSMCEHHLLPFFGRAHVGYVPSGKIAGASKLARALDVVARRPQVQERMTHELADAIYRSLLPDGVAVVLEAEHLCMSMRGVRKPGSTVVTTAARGPFARGVIDSRDFLAQLQRR
jgi:GTP cyclohydrolase I